MRIRIAAAKRGTQSDEGVKSLAELVTDASALLYHAVVSGQNIGAELRDPIIRLREAVTAGQSVSAEAESKFLNAYARLAVLVAPVTAATLRATSRHTRVTPGWRASFGFRRCRRPSSPPSSSASSPSACS